MASASEERELAVGRRCVEPPPGGCRFIHLGEALALPSRPYLGGGPCAGDGMVAAQRDDRRPSTGWRAASASCSARRTWRSHLATPRSIQPPVLVALGPSSSYTANRTTDGRTGDTNCLAALNLPYPSRIESRQEVENATGAFGACVMQPAYSVGRAPPPRSDPADAASTPR